ncbi:histidine--tRNA ligase [Anaeromicrobium sediminis]|uniref:Histidine--tRNA ligase n=2 Tax=Anaeromicrobium sediminis TaxID=1478221 RepID=A0A267MMZ5_9FIRM|nr:histidine--tRNA ligase [Anaeromicrobium sediminis]
MKMKAPRGTKDVLPKDVYKWHYLEDTFRETCKNFGYNEIRTPIFEHTELFKRGVGETTDIVQKEMYSFEDNGGRDITLKPEGTAPVVRAFIEHKLYADAQPTKLYYATPCFRYERPQAGRLRAFHQFGIEVFGTTNPQIDAEIIGVAMDFFSRLHIKNLELRINSVGCKKCRSDYNEVLKKYLSTKVEKLCNTCNDRYERNPMRIIDCKNEKCKEEVSDIPLMIDHLCEECSNDFNQLKESLNLMDIGFIVDPKIVRGLDYYTKTAFEIISNEIGSQSTVCGGGRYDGLIEQLGGPSMPGIGFGMGIERLLLTLENNNIEIPKPDKLDVFIVSLGEKSNRESVKILKSIREENLSADKDYLERSMKAQFKYANKRNARFCIVIGENEIEKGVVTLKNMETGDQTEISIDNIGQEIKNICK